MKPEFWYYLILFLVGFAILAYPDEGSAVIIRFSATHGPSFVDLVGIFFIMAGYIPMAFGVVRHFYNITSTIGKPIACTLILVSLLCGFFIAIALRVESDVMLWLFVAMSILSQGSLIFQAFRLRAEG